jgi:hypothetical protein
VELGIFLGVCNGSCCSNGASTSTSASTGNVGSTGGSKHQLPKLAEYDDWVFTPIGYFRSLAIALVLAIALALAIAPLKYWRQLGKG